MKAKWTLLSPRLRNNGPPLRDINHQPLSPDICLYVFKFSGRKHTSSVFTFHVNRQPLRLHFKPENPASSQTQRRQVACTAQAK